MGSSGPMALVKNAHVFAIAAFACIGGVLYGYNVRINIILPTQNISRLQDTDAHVHSKECSVAF